MKKIVVLLCLFLLLTSSMNANTIKKDISRKNTVSSKITSKEINFLNEVYVSISLSAFTNSSHQAVPVQYTIDQNIMYAEIFIFENPLVATEFLYKTATISKFFFLNYLNLSIKHEKIKTNDSISFVVDSKLFLFKFRPKEKRFLVEISISKL